MGVHIDCGNAHGPSRGLIHNTRKKKVFENFLKSIQNPHQRHVNINHTGNDDHKQPRRNTVSTFFLLIHFYLFIFTVKHEHKHEMDHHHHYYHLHDRHHNTPPPQYTAATTDSNSNSIVTKNDGLETHWCLEIPST